MDVIPKYWFFSRLTNDQLKADTITTINRDIDRSFSFLYRRNSPARITNTINCGLVKTRNSEQIKINIRIIIFLVARYL
jgi:hypothetical protein